MKHTVEVETPEVVRFVTEVTFLCGESVVTMSKREPFDPDDDAWNLLNLSGTFDECVDVALKFVDKAEASRLLHKKLKETNG